MPATVNDYREKLLHLRKLRCDIAQPAIPSGSLLEVRIYCQKAVVTFLNSKRMFLFHHMDCRVFNESASKSQLTLRLGLRKLTC